MTSCSSSPEHAEGLARGHRRFLDTDQRAWRERVPAFPTSIARRDARHAYAVLGGLTASSEASWPRPPPPFPRARAKRDPGLPLCVRPRPVLRGRAVPAGPRHCRRRRRALRARPALDDERHSRNHHTQQRADARPATNRSSPAHPGGTHVVGNSVNGSFSSTCSARHCFCSRPPPASTISMATDGAPPRSPPRRSNVAGASRTPESGRLDWTTGRIAA